MKVVTICGSLKFEEDMIKIAGELETKENTCVLQCIYGLKNLTDDEKKKLAELHYKKIDISDAIYVVNIGGYIGESTKLEIEYAQKHKKEIIYHERDKRR